MKTVKHITAALAAAAALAACSRQGAFVSLADYQAAIDSISAANGCRIYVDSLAYARFPLRAENFQNEKRHIARSASNRDVLYRLRRDADYYTTPLSHSDAITTVAEAAADARRNEAEHSDRRNRVTWREFETTMHREFPGVELISKKEWRRQRMTRSDLADAVNRNKALNRLPGTYTTRRDSATGHIITERVTDPAEEARMQKLRDRIHYTRNGMTGVSPELSKVRSGNFGAEGYDLQGAGHLFLKVRFWNGYPNPADSVRAEVTSAEVFAPQADDYHANYGAPTAITISRPTFRAFSTSPFRYSFTGSFEYGGQWYYLFLCEDPHKCVCRPVRTDKG